MRMEGKMMPQVKFNPEISLGNVLTIFGCIVVVIIGWTTMQLDIRQEKDARLKIELQVQKLQDKDDLMLEAIRSNQNFNAASLAELKAQMSILLSRTDKK